MSNQQVENEFYAMPEIGLLKMQGPDSLDFLHRLSTQTFKGFGGEASITSTVFPTNHGKIVDWAWVIQGEDCWWIRTAAQRGARLKQWLEKFIIMEDVALEDHSDLVRGCVIQSAACMQYVGGEIQPGHVHFEHGGYWYHGLKAYGTRLDGWFAAEHTETMVKRFEAGGIERASDEMLEGARLQAGVPSPQWEYAQEVSPLELRLMRDAIAWNKGCYIGQEVISRMDSYDKVKRLLVGFSTEGSLPESEPLRIRKDGKTLGKVTSFQALPSGLTIGLAIAERYALGQIEVEITSSDASFAAVLEDRPFWQDSSE